MKTSKGYPEDQPQGECTQCSQPYPYVCHGCKSVMDEALSEEPGLSASQSSPAQPSPQPIYIGSGEDMHPSVWNNLDLTPEYQFC